MPRITTGLKLCLAENVRLNEKEYNMGEKRLTDAEAFKLMTIKPGEEKSTTVTVRRGGAAWTGEIIGIARYPSVILDTSYGRRVIAIDGATFEVKNNG